MSEDDAHDDMVLLDREKARDFYRTVVEPVLAQHPGPAGAREVICLLAYAAARCTASFGGNCDNFGDFAHKMYHFAEVDLRLALPASAAPAPARGSHN